MEKSAEVVMYLSQDGKCNGMTLAIKSRLFNCTALTDSSC